MLLDAGHIFSVKGTSDPEVDSCPAPPLLIGEVCTDDASVAFELVALANLTLLLRAFCS